MMFQDQKIPVVGIVGGIGSGKSTVAEEFEHLGCYRIDCDKLGHAALDEEDVKRQLRALWGDNVFDADGDVNRRAVADVVFNDPKQLAALESIVHPRIREGIVRGIAEGKARNAPAIIVDAAVLFEAGWDDLCTDIVFVEASREERFARVKERRGWDDSTMQLRESRQIPLDKKQSRCHHSIHNHSSVSYLKVQVGQLLYHITHE